MPECQPCGRINKSGEGASKGKKIFQITNANSLRNASWPWLHNIGTNGHCVDGLILIVKSFVEITLQNSMPISKRIATYIAICWDCLYKTFERRPPVCHIKPRTRSWLPGAVKHVQRSSKTSIISLFCLIDTIYRSR